MSAADVEMMGGGGYYPCPWCRSEQISEDIEAAGELDAGRVFLCGDCGQPIEITGVDRSPTFWVRRFGVRAGAA